MSESFTPGKFCWFECGSRDAAAAKRFYTKLFDWDAVDMPMPGDMGGQYTMLKLGDADVGGLYELSGQQFEGVPSHWATYVGVRSVDETTERANVLGGKTVAPPMDIPGVGRMSVIADPTGATICLFQPGEHQGSPPQGPMPGTFGWSELATRDTDRAGKFYSELFDWKMKTDQGDPIPYTEFQVGGESIGGMMAMTEHHGDAPPHWLPYVMVEDCDAAFGKATKLGARTYVPPMDIPNVGRFAVFADPTGAALAIIQLTGQP